MKQHTTCPKRHADIKRFQQLVNWVHHTTTLSLFTIQNVPQKLIALEILLQCCYENEYVAEWHFCISTLKSFNC